MNPLCTALALSLALLLTTSAQAVSSLFWSFESTVDGTGAFSGTVTDNDGFGTPSYAQTAGTGGSSAGSAAGGTSYTHEGTEWAGDGGTTTPGHSLIWGTTTSLNHIEEARLTVNMSTVDLYDLTMRFDIRIGSNGTAKPGDRFSAIEYFNGTTWVTTGVTSPVWSNTGSAGFQSVSIDLSGVSAIENSADVRLRFTFADGAVPTVATTQNIRMDNLLFTAVPEPGVAGLLMLGVMAVGLRRRRQQQWRLKVDGLT